MSYEVKEGEVPFGVFSPENMTSGGAALGSESKPTAAIIMAGYGRVEPYKDKNTGEVQKKGNKDAGPEIKLRMVVQCEGSAKLEKVDVSLGGGSCDKFAPDGTKEIDLSDSDANVKALMGEGFCDGIVACVESPRLNENTGAALFFASMAAVGIADSDKFAKIAGAASTLNGCKFHFARQPWGDLTDAKGQPITALAVQELVEAGENWDEAPTKPVKAAAKSVSKPAAAPAKAAPVAAKPAASKPAASAKVVPVETGLDESAIVVAVQDILAAQGETAKVKLLGPLMKGLTAAGWTSKQNAEAVGLINKTDWLGDNAKAGGWEYEDGLVKPNETLAVLIEARG